MKQDDKKPEGLVIIFCVPAEQCEKELINERKEKANHGQNASF